MKIGIKTQTFVFALAIASSIIGQDVAWIFYPAMFLMGLSVFWGQVFGHKDTPGSRAERGRDK